MDEGLVSDKKVVVPSWRRLIGFPGAVGTILGLTGALIWQHMAEPAMNSEDSLGLLILYTVVALPLGLIASWALLAWATNAWRAPTVTFAGSLVAWCVQMIIQEVAHVKHAPPLVVALVWGAGFAAVAVACLPDLRRGIRIPVTAVLLVPVVVNHLMH